MFRSKMRILLGKIESTYGTDSVPVVGTNALDASNVKVKDAGEVLERNDVRADMSPVAPVMGKRRVEVTFSTPLKGSGALGTAPIIGALLQACGLAETVSAGSSVTYLPTSGVHKSVTLYVYDIPDTGNAKLKAVLGCRGTFKLNAEAGKFGAIEWTFQGLSSTPTDVSAPSAPTLESTVPPVVQSTAFTLNGVTSLIVQKVEIDMGNGLADRDDVSATSSGLKEIIIGERKPMGSFNPEKVLSATYDFFADFKDATARALSMVIGATAGNKCTITAPKVTLDGLDEADRNGILTLENPFRLSRSSGNDEVSFKFE